MKKVKKKFPKIKMPLIKLPWLKKKKSWEKSDDALIKKEENARRKREKEQKQEHKKEQKAKKVKEKKPKVKKTKDASSTNKKLPIKKILPAFLVVAAGIIALAAFLPSSLKDGVISFSPNTVDSDMLTHAVSKALLSEENVEVYMGGECPAEGHIIMGSEITEGGEIKAYLLTMTGFYGFIDDHFVKISGSGMVPAVFTFEDNEKEYQLLDMEFPLTGDGFEASVSAMFPEEYIERAASQSKNDVRDLTAQEREYAKTYLAKIGSEAEVGDYADFDIQLLRESGVPVEITNFIAQSKDLSHYPYWIGTCEYVEDEVNYTYNTDFDKDRNRIVMKKYNSDTPDVLVEHIEIDSVTREMKIF